MKLLIDIGNTRIKWLLCETSDDASHAEIHYAADLNELKPAWKLITSIKCLSIANVNQQKCQQQIIELAQQYWPAIVIKIAQTCAQAYGVTNAYARPEDLGIDRWLALIAVNCWHSLPAIIVDCGTAVTIDVLAQDGCHQGGLIVPGLNLMQLSLQQETHRLPAADSTAQVSLGLSTPTCIANGVLISIVGLIEKVYQQFSDVEGSNYTLILTGGDAPIIGQHLSVTSLVETNTVLQGLAILSND